MYCFPASLVKLHDEVLISKTCFHKNSQTKIAPATLKYFRLIFTISFDYFINVWLMILYWSTKTCLFVEKKLLNKYGLVQGKNHVWKQWKSIQHVLINLTRLKVSNECIYHGHQEEPRNLFWNWLGLLNIQFF